MNSFPRFIAANQQRVESSFESCNKYTTKQIAELQFKILHLIGVCRLMNDKEFQEFQNMLQQFMRQIDNEHIMCRYAFDWLVTSARFKPVFGYSELKNFIGGSSFEIDQFQKIIEYVYESNIIPNMKFE